MRVRMEGVDCAELYTEVESQLTRLANRRDAAHVALSSSFARPLALAVLHRLLVTSFARLSAFPSHSYRTTAHPSTSMYVPLAPLCSKSITSEPACAACKGEGSC